MVFVVFDQKKIPRPY